MNQKQIGIILIIIGILLAVFTIMAKAREDSYIDSFIEETKSCYLDDGTCLHNDRSFGLYIFGDVLSAALIVLGVYLFIFDRTQKILADQQLKITSALKEAKDKENEKDEFNAFLTAFTEDEKKVLSAVKEQDGIQQSTLRFRAGISKTALSLMLKSFEEREIITREPSGKTNKIHLVKMF